MKTLQARLNSYIFAILAIAVIFGYQAWLNNNNMEQLQNKLSKSLLLRDKIQDLNPKSIDKDFIKELQKLKNSIEEMERYEAVSNVIQAYNAKNPKLFHSRIKEFEKVERTFFNYSQVLIKRKKKQVQFYLFLTTVLPFCMLLGLLYFLNFGVFSPLQSLSKRMMEFLIDQYTFRFSSPANNEIGNLERTFNSLAQKVLNNMDELHALDQAKSEFVNIASHELRTPLTSIKGSLGLLSGGIVGDLDDAATEMVQVAEQETDRLVRLINDMLDLAKIESRSLTLKKDWIQLEDLITKTSQGLQGFATAANVEFHTQFWINNIDLNIDSDRIQQVLTNLISNAIKYSPPSGLVTIATTKNNSGKIEISVTDQGPGISEENQQLIFEKFRQATDSTNHLVKGTGLGLAISKALIEEHEGEIGIRSKPGQGSTFYFTVKEWRPTTNKHKSSETAA